MGRPRKSIEISKRLGSAEAQRIENRYDIRPGGLPDPPVWLSHQAAKVWQDVCPKLEEAGLVQSVDAEMVGQYCEALATWIQEKRRRKNRDPVLVARWFEIAARIGKSLGMSPQARTSITIPAPEKSDDLDSLIA